MKTFEIKYFFDGFGTCNIEADTLDEAKEKFFNGEYKNENEWGDNYEIDDYGTDNDELNIDK